MNNNYLFIKAFLFSCAFLAQPYVQAEDSSLENRHNSSGKRPSASNSLTDTFTPPAKRPAISISHPEKMANDQPAQLSISGYRAAPAAIDCDSEMDCDSEDDLQEGISAAPQTENSPINAQSTLGGMPVDIIICLSPYIKPADRARLSLTNPAMAFKISTAEKTSVSQFMTRTPELSKLMAKSKILSGPYYQRSVYNVIHFLPQLLELENMDFPYQFSMTQRTIISDINRPILDILIKTGNISLLIYKYRFQSAKSIDQWVELSNPGEMTNELDILISTIIFDSLTQQSTIVGKKERSHYDLNRAESLLRLLPPDNKRTRILSDILSFHKAGTFISPLTTIEYHAVKQHDTYKEYQLLELINFPINTEVSVMQVLNDQIAGGDKKSIMYAVDQIKKNRAANKQHFPSLTKELILTLIDDQPLYLIHYVEYTYLNEHTNDMVKAHESQVETESLLYNLAKKGNLPAPLILHTIYSEGISNELQIRTNRGLARFYLPKMRECHYKEEFYSLYKRIFSDPAGITSIIHSPFLLDLALRISTWQESVQYILYTLINNEDSAGVLYTLVNLDYINEINDRHVIKPSGITYEQSKNLYSQLFYSLIRKGNIDTLRYLMIKFSAHSYYEEFKTKYFSSPDIAEDFLRREVAKNNPKAQKEHVRQLNQESEGTGQEYLQHFVQQGQSWAMKLDIKQFAENNPPKFITTKAKKGKKVIFHAKDNQDVITKLLEKIERAIELGYYWANEMKAEVLFFTRSELVFSETELDFIAKYLPVKLTYRLEYTSSLRYFIRLDQHNYVHRLTWLYNKLIPKNTPTSKLTSNFKRIYALITPEFKTIIGQPNTPTAEGFTFLEEQSQLGEDWASKQIEIGIRNSRQYHHSNKKERYQELITQGIKSGSKWAIKIHFDNLLQKNKLRAAFDFLNEQYQQGHLWIFYTLYTAIKSGEYERAYAIYLPHIPLIYAGILFEDKYNK